MFGKAYQVMQQEKVEGHLYYHYDIEYLLLGLLSKNTDTNYPILEVGCFDGKCSTFFYESALQDKRQFKIVDLFKFISHEKHNDFISEVLLTRLAKINPHLENLNILYQDGTDINFSDINPSFLLHDIAADELPQNFLEYIPKMPDKSIIAMVNLNIGFRPNYLNTVYDLMNQGAIYLFAASNHISFFTTNLSFKNHLETSLSNDPVWLYCKKIGLSGTPKVGTQTFHRFRTVFGQQNALDSYKQQYSIG